MEDFVVCVLVDGTRYTEIKNEEKDGWISSWALLDLFSGVLEMCVFFLPFFWVRYAFALKVIFGLCFLGFCARRFPPQLLQTQTKATPMCVKVRAFLGEKVFMLCMFQEVRLVWLSCYVFH